MPEIIKKSRIEPSQEILLAEIEKNNTTQIRVTLARWDRHPHLGSDSATYTSTLGIREWFLWQGRTTPTIEDATEPKFMQEWRPTQRGIAINMEHAGDLMEAIAKAVEQELKWIDAS